jgi:exodeoxyribonuclease V alpha subunit
MRTPERAVSRWVRAKKKANSTRAWRSSISSVTSNLIQSFLRKLFAPEKGESGETRHGDGQWQDTVLGHAAVMSAGEFIQASGEWIKDRTHGVQFRAHFLKAMAPTTAEGIEKYLASGMIRGIGPVYAKKLVCDFKDQVFDVIEAEPHRLQEVTGIGQKTSRCHRCRMGRAARNPEIMIFLHSHGVSTSRAVRIFKTYGADGVQTIPADPYRLARDIRGIGFRTADAIAMKLGIEKTAMIRARAGISFALTEANDDGHCSLPHDELLPLAVKLLEIPSGIVEDAIHEELKQGVIIADQVEDRGCVFLAGLYRAEQSIAARLKTIARGGLPWPRIDADKAIPWVEEKAGLALAESQQGRDQNRSRVKGDGDYRGPGCGKKQRSSTPSCAFFGQESRTASLRAGFCFAWHKCAKA